MRAMTLNARSPHRPPPPSSSSHIRPHRPPSLLLPQSTSVYIRHWRFTYDTHSTCTRIPRCAVQRTIRERCNRTLYENFYLRRRGCVFASICRFACLSRGLLKITDEFLNKLGKKSGTTTVNLVAEVQLCVVSIGEYRSRNFTRG